MADISGGETWVDGEQVTDGRLNNHVNGAVILPAFVSSKTLMASGDLAGNDSLLVYDLSDASDHLKRTTPTNLFAAFGGGGTVTSVALSLPADTFLEGGAVTTAGTLSATHISQNAGEVHIAPVGAGGVPTWRRLEARDVRVAPVNIAASAIDWNLSNTFWKTLTAHTVFAFTNSIEGRPIDVLVGQGGAGSFTVDWVTPGLSYFWVGGTVPVQTVTVSHWDWYRFTLISTNVFAARIAANLAFTP